ncbi:hypothetical protein DC522_16465 [Microvirga sp. KLBC 81]|nr:hypothetical protein DC522_16465 [Microvirga sp. KLBC 81]
MKRSDDTSDDEYLIGIYYLHIRDELGLIEYQNGIELPDSVSLLMEVIQSVDEFTREAAIWPDALRGDRCCRPYGFDDACSVKFGHLGVAGEFVGCRGEHSLEHRAEKWIRFSARTMLLFKEKASGWSQKCKSTFGSDAVVKI